MKKTAALFMCVLYLAPAAFSSAQETPIPSQDGFHYTFLEDGTVSITRFEVTSLIIPGQIAGQPVTALGESAINFQNSLTSVTLPDSLKEIGKYALYNNKSLESVLIPAGVTAIGYGAFYSCPALSAIAAAPGNPVYESVDGVLYDRQKSLLHTYPGGRAGDSYTVAEGTLLIHDYAFARTPLREVILPAGLQEIGFAAFSECASLAALELPEGLTSIYGSAFRDDTALTSLAIPASVTWIGTEPFAGCVGLTLKVRENSYGHNYAVENNLPFTLITE